MACSWSAYSCPATKALQLYVRVYSEQTSVQQSGLSACPWHFHCPWRRQENLLPFLPSLYRQPRPSQKLRTQEDNSREEDTEQINLDCGALYILDKGNSILSSLSLGPHYEKQSQLQGLQRLSLCVSAESCLWANTPGGPRDICAQQRLKASLVPVWSILGPIPV